MSPGLFVKRVDRIVAKEESAQLGGEGHFHTSIAPFSFPTCHPFGRHSLGLQGEGRFIYSSNQNLWPSQVQFVRSMVTWCKVKNDRRGDSMLMVELYFKANQLNLLIYSSSGVVPESACEM